MEIIQLEKSSYSEWVVRNSLYWLSSSTPWQLKSNEYHWLITLENSNTAIHQELDRLLNDYILRERIMGKTDKIREVITTNVFKGIQARLTE